MSVLCSQQRRKHKKEWLYPQDVHSGVDTSSGRYPLLQCLQEQAPQTLPAGSCQHSFTRSCPSPLRQLASQLPQPQTDLREHLRSEDRKQSHGCDI